MKSPARLSAISNGPLLSVLCFCASLQANAQSFGSSSLTFTNNPASTNAIAWGDYDNDGDLDVAVAGLEFNESTQAQSSFTYLYQNQGNGTFRIVTTVSFQGVSNGGLAWGDFDNDGWLDLAVTGVYDYFASNTNTKNYYTKVYKNNHNGTFSAPASIGSFTGLCYGSVDWGDYNKDGYLDLLVCGLTGTGNQSSGQTLLYKNNGNGTFSNVATALPGVGIGNAQWGDYDNDGDPDVLLCGNNAQGQPYAAVYRNDAGVFSNINAGLPQVTWASAAWGDYDADGKLDIAIIGSTNANYVTNVFHNEGSDQFYNVSANSSFSATAYGQVVWGDFNNDGKSDFAITGENLSYIITYIYSGNDVFTTQSTGIRSSQQSSLAPADYNNDNTVDLAAGVGGVHILYNTLSNPVNQPPSSPQTPRAFTFGNSVYMNWAAGDDDYNSSGGQTFNVSIAPTSGGNSPVAPEADLLSGVRRVAHPGNAGARMATTYNLPNGTYKWQVQGIDNSYKGSPFTSQGSFTIPGASNICYIKNPSTINVCGGSNTVLEAYGWPTPTSYQWYKNGAIMSGQTGQQLTVTQSGNYTAHAVTSTGTVQSVNSVAVTVAPRLSNPYNVQSGNTCAGTSITLSATPGSSGATCRWYDPAGNYLATGGSITVTPTVTSTYMVETYDATSGCASGRVQANAVINPIPPAPTAAPTQGRCGPGQVELVATPVSPADAIIWYADADRTSVVSTASHFQTAYLSQSVTYYAAGKQMSTGCAGSALTPVTAAIYNQPLPPYVPAVSRCGPGGVTLIATVQNGVDACRWYAGANKTRLLGTGLTYNLTSSVDTFVYASSYISQAACESAQTTIGRVHIFTITDQPFAENGTGYSSCRVPLYARPPLDASTCRWYSDSLKQHFLYAGLNFTTPRISVSTPYWVSGYDAQTHCEGPLKKVFAVILPPPPATVNPDQRYPIPNNYGDSLRNDVNLLTGDVNLYFPLGTVGSNELSFTVNAAYNSRSVALSPLYSDNVLGGCGWKLLDYPKIAYDQLKNQYFFLDGNQAYPLKTGTVNAQNYTTSYTSDGDSWLYNFVQTNTNSAVTARKWIVTASNGTVYYFNGTAVAADGNAPGGIWNLSLMRDAQYVDSLSFAYDGQGRLTQVACNTQQSLKLTYNGGKLISVGTYILHSGSADVESVELQLNYSKICALDTSKAVLSEMSVMGNIQQKIGYTAALYPAAPSTKFIYADSIYPGALSQVVSPDGAIRTYAYGTITLSGKRFYPVQSVRTFSGNLHQYNGATLDETAPVAIDYQGLMASRDGYYLLSNQTTLFPGSDERNTIFDDQSTSFESGKGDSLFSNLNKDKIVKTYALSGKHSYFFNSTLIPDEITSNKFYLTRKQMSLAQDSLPTNTSMQWTGSYDSIQLMMYAFDTHASLKVDFYVNFYFYDQRGVPISYDHQNPQMDDDRYGKWTQFVFKYGIPENAVAFSFGISGGDAAYDYDFYLDNVAISGADWQVQGAEVFSFFNTDSIQNLRHLPDNYFQDFDDGATALAAYYSGFEQSLDYTDWLQISGDCKAKVTANSPDRAAAYNGTNALRMRACDDNKKTSINTKSIHLPAGTKSVLLSFHYSNAQIAGMEAQVKGDFNNNNAPLYNTLKLGDSYFIDPHYQYFQRVYTIPTNATTFTATITVTDDGKGNGINDFFIDDLNLLFLDKNVSNNQPIVQVRDSLLTGRCYHYKMRNSSNVELAANGSYFLPATANGTRYVQYKEFNNTQRSTAHSGAELTFNTIGLPESSTTLWVRTNADSSKTNVYSKEMYGYAYQTYPALNTSGLYMLNAQSVKYSSVSTDQKQTWAITNGTVTQWKPFLYGTKTFWVPWRVFSLKSSITQAQLNTVITSLHDSTYTPPATQWKLNTQTISINSIGQAAEIMTTDSLHTVDFYALNNFNISPDTRLKRPATVVAQFVNAGAKNCFYLGFEPYEPMSSSAGITPDTQYVHTGENGAKSFTNVSFNYNASGALSAKYVFGFYAMPRCNTVYVKIQNSSGTYYLNKSISIPSAQQNIWGYYEAVFDMPAYTGALKFSLSISSGSISYDDLRFSPIDAEMQATVYDPVTFSTTAHLGNNGETERVLYDRMHNQIATVQNNEQPEKLDMEYSSRSNPDNRQTFNPADPNSSTTVQIKGTGAYYSFGDSKSATQWSITNGIGSPGYKPLQGISVRAGGAANLLSTYIPSDKKDFALSFRFVAHLNTAQSATQKFAIDLGGTGVALSINKTSPAADYLWTKQNSSWVKYDTIARAGVLQSVAAYDCALICQGGNLYCWVNGALAVRMAYNSANFTQLKFTLDNGSFITGLDIQDIQISLDALVHVDYFDAVGQKIQSQDLVETGVVIGETIYDRMNRPVLRTNDVLVPNASLGFRTGFVTSFDWSSGAMLGEVNFDSTFCLHTTYDNGYYYMRNVYDNSPKMTVINKFTPGYDFALRDKTNWEKSKTWIYNHEDDIISAIGYAADAVDIIINPSEAPFIIGMDIAQAVVSYAVNKAVAYYVNSKDNEQNEIPVGTSYFDDKQNEILRKLPNANSKSSKKANQIVNLTYDFENRLIQEISPEAGTVRLVYGASDQLRFYADQNDLTNNQVRYAKYDRQGQITEDGYFNMVWNTQTLTSLAANPAYPGTAQSPIVTKSFKYNGAGGNCEGCYLNRGRITSAYSARSDTSSNTITYVYDQDGRVVSNQSVIIDRDQTTQQFTTGYTYDNMDNILRITYPTVQNKAFSVTYAWDKSNRNTKITTSESSTPLAILQYNPDGTLILDSISCNSGKQPIPMRYMYNPGGLAVSVNAGNLVGQTMYYPGAVYPITTYENEFYTITYNYNFLQDWWSKLWGQAYYNGNLAAADFDPGPNSGLTAHKQGYNYNDSGFLEQYYSSLQNENLDVIDDEVPYESVYDLNGNLKKNTFEYEGQTRYKYKVGWHYKYDFDNTQNRTNMVDYYYYNDLANNRSGAFRKDTLRMGYDEAGNIDNLTYFHHNSYERDKQPGSLISSYSKVIYYDHWGHATKFIQQKSGSIDTTTRLEYDAYGYRVWKQVTSNTDRNKLYTTNYIRGVANMPIMEVVKQGNTTYMRYYIQGPEGLIAYFKYASNQMNSWAVLNDVQGSTLALVNRTTRAVDAAYAYDAYGQLIGAHLKSPTMFNYLYNGQEYDPEIGFYNYKARMYDPWLKLFLSPDPKEENPSTPYAYTENDPVNYGDPSGEGKLLLKSVVFAKPAEIAKAKLLFQDYKTIEELLLGGGVNALDKPKRVGKWKLEIYTRLNSRDAAMIAELKNLRVTKNPAWAELKEVLRPGGMHEMLPVSRIAESLEIGFTVDDVQKFVIPTEDAKFMEVDDLTLTEHDHHGTSVGSAAHKDIFDILERAKNKGRTRIEVTYKLKRWMKGKKRGYSYRMSPRAYKLAKKTGY